MSPGRPSLTARALFVMVGLLAPPARSSAQSTASDYAAVGLFIGSIEEGARIFTPVRFLPFGHAEAGTHQFPTVLQLHATEFPLLVWLGNQTGFRLWPTLERYPTLPDTTWPYAGLRAPPDTALLASAPVRHFSKHDAPIPGLRAALYDEATLVAFLVDTRGLTLAERGLDRPTTMGLDLTRAEFLRRASLPAPLPQPDGAIPKTRYTVVIWDR